MKKCRACNEEKPDEDFYPKRKVCKKCFYENAKTWNEANPDKRRKSSADWKQRNPERAREIDREVHAKIRATKKEVLQERHKSWVSKNIEKVRNYLREWKRNNPEAKRSYRQKRRAQAKGNGGSFTTKEWVDLCDKYENKCLRCGAKTKLTPDHIVPISEGGTSYITNIQPLCQSCNSWKKTKTIDYRIQT